MRFCNEQENGSLFESPRQTIPKTPQNASMSSTPICRTRPFRNLILPRHMHLIRPFTVPARLHIKEDADRSPEEVERVKQEHLREQQQGKGRWHEELASASESTVAADREEVKDDEGHMKELQEKTAEKAERRHPEGKS